MIIKLCYELKLSLFFHSQGTLPGYTAMWTKHFPLEFELLDFVAYKDLKISLAGEKDIFEKVIDMDGLSIYAENLDRYK